MPHGLWSSKLHERDALHPVDAPSVELCSPTDSVEVDGAVLLETSQGLCAHAALANHRAYAIFADDVGLIGLLSNARGWTRRGHLPIAVGLFRHHRAAVINDAAAQVHGRRMARQMMVHCVASGVRG